MDILKSLLVGLGIILVALLIVGVGLGAVWAVAYALSPTTPGIASVSIITVGVLLILGLAFIMGDDIRHG